MAQVVVEMTSEEAKLWAAQQKAAMGFRDMEQSASKANVKIGQLDRDTQRALRAMETAQERYNRKLAEADRLLKAGAISQQQHARAVAHAKSEMDAAGKSGETAFGPRMLGNVQSLTSALGLGAGLAGVLGTVVGEFRQLIEVQERAKDLTLTVADAQRAAYRNLGASTDAERDSFDKQVSDIAAKTGMSVRDVYMVAGDAMSARGDISLERTYKAVELGARVAPDDTSTAKVMAGAALDLQKIKPIDAEQSMGFLSIVGQMARITDFGRIAKNATPAINATVAAGASMEDAGSLFAALTQSMADMTGEQSKTATIQLTEQLRKFSTGEINKSESDAAAWSKLNVPQELATAGAGAQLAYLQQNPEAREFLRNRLTGEAAALTPFRQLISGQGNAASLFRNFQERMPQVDSWDDTFRDRLGVMDRGEIQRTAELDRRVGVVQEGLRLSNQAGARADILRKGGAEILADAGLPKWAGRIADVTRELEPDKVGRFVDEMELARSQLASPTYISGGGGFGQNFYAPTAGVRQRTATETRQLEAFDRVLPQLRDLLQELVDSQKRQEKPATLSPPDRDR